MARKIARSVVSVVLVALLAGCMEFAAPSDHAVPLGSDELVTGMLTGDLTGDGRDDVLLTRQERPNADDATFGAVPMLACGGGCMSVGEVIENWRPVLVDDFDADGADDAVMLDTQWYEGDARLYFGGPGGAGRPAGLSPDDWVALPPSYPYEAGDFDGDGDLDLLTSNVEYGYYLFHDILSNDGDGQFTLALSDVGWSGPLNAGGGGVVIAHDGVADRIYFRNLEETRIDVGPGNNYAVADIDGDGREDLAHLTDDRVTFLRNTGAGFTPFPDYQTIEYQAGGVSVELTDLDGDGLVDFTMHDENSPLTGGDRIVYLGGSGDGGFPYEPRGELPPRRARFADVDGDGLPEAVTTTEDLTAIKVYPNISTK